MRAASLYLYLAEELGTAMAFRLALQAGVRCCYMVGNPYY